MLCDFVVRQFLHFFPFSLLSLSFGERSCSLGVLDKQSFHLEVVMNKSLNVLRAAGGVLSVRLDIGFEIFTWEICAKNSGD